MKKSDFGQNSGFRFPKITFFGQNLVDFCPKYPKNRIFQKIPHAGVKLDRFWHLLDIVASSGSFSIFQPFSILPISLNSQRVPPVKIKNFRKKSDFFYFFKNDQKTSQKHQGIILRAETSFFEQKSMCTYSTVPSNIF